MATVSNTWIKGWLRNKDFITNPKHEHYNRIIDELLIRLRAGKNTICTTVGEPRSGKSYFSFWLMCYMNWCYFGREEFNPENPDSKKILKECHFNEIRSFIRATLKPENRYRFLVFEEVSVSKNKMDYHKKELQNINKLEDIFGIDEVSTINTLPFLFTLEKTARLKTKLIFVAEIPFPGLRVISLHKRIMNQTTDKARIISLRYNWKNPPNIADKYPELMAKYEEEKQRFNRKQKMEWAEFSSDEIKSGSSTPGIKFTPST